MILRRDLTYRQSIEQTCIQFDVSDELTFHTNCRRLTENKLLKTNTNDLLGRSLCTFRYWFPVYTYIKTL